MYSEFKDQQHTKSNGFAQKHDIFNDSSGLWPLQNRQKSQDSPADDFTALYFDIKKVIQPLESEEPEMPPGLQSAVGNEESSSSVTNRSHESDLQLSSAFTQGQPYNSTKALEPVFEIGSFDQPSEHNKSSSKLNLKSQAFVIPEPVGQGNQAEEPALVNIESKNQGVREENISKQEQDVPIEKIGIEKQEQETKAEVKDGENTPQANQKEEEEVKGAWGNPLKKKNPVVPQKEKSDIKENRSQSKQQHAHLEPPAKPAEGNEPNVQSEKVENSYSNKSKIPENIDNRQKVSNKKKEMKKDANNDNASVEKDDFKNVEPKYNASQKPEKNKREKIAENKFKVFEELDASNGRKDSGTDREKSDNEAEKEKIAASTEAIEIQETEEPKEENLPEESQEKEQQAEPNPENAEGKKKKRKKKGKNAEDPNKKSQGPQEKEVSSLTNLEPTPNPTPGENKETNLKNEEEKIEILKADENQPIEKETDKAPEKDAGSSESAEDEDKAAGSLSEIKEEDKGSSEKKSKGPKNKKKKNKKKKKNLGEIEENPELQNSLKLEFGGKSGMEEVSQLKLKMPEDKSRKAERSEPMPILFFQPFTYYDDIFDRMTVTQ